MTGANWTARLACTTSERYQIYQLRYAVYVEEMGKPYLSADSANGVLTDALDESATLVALLDPDGQVMGSVRCNYAAEIVGVDPLATRLGIHAFPADLLCHVTVCSRLVLARGSRKRGTLWPLIRAIFRWGLLHDIHVNLIHTALPLVPMFEHIGFRPFGAPFRDDDAGSEQQALFLLLHDLSHLRGVNSPFVDELESALHDDITLQNTPRPDFRSFIRAADCSESAKTQTSVAGALR